MSVYLRLKDKPILHIKNILFADLYNTMLDIIDKKNLIINERLQRLIDKLYLGCYGTGLDFIEYLTTKQDAEFFLALLKEAIEAVELMFVPPYKEDIMNSFWDFYNALHEYTQTLP